MTTQQITGEYVQWHAHGAGCYEGAQGVHIARIARERSRWTARFTDYPFASFSARTLWQARAWVDSQLAILVLNEAYAEQEAREASTDWHLLSMRSRALKRNEIAAYAAASGELNRRRQAAYQALKGAQKAGLPVAVLEDMLRADECSSEFVMARLGQLWKEAEKHAMEPYVAACARAEREHTMHAFSAQFSEPKERFWHIMAPGKNMSLCGSLYGGPGVALVLDSVSCTKCMEVFTDGVVFSEIHKS